MKQQFGKVILAFLTACVLLTPAGNAQDYRGKVQGLVTDSSSAIVAGATVTLLNTKTGVATTRQTNEEGLYLVNYVELGTYTITIEKAGFRRFVQQNVEVRSFGDMTVNAALSIGDTSQAITVSESVTDVAFNSSNVAVTVNERLVNELPRIDRNPFKMALLDPSARNTYDNMNPYISWAANSVELGGGTSQKNDVQVDGSSVSIGFKATYTPPPDAVAEVSVMQNAVDAEFGHSAGGVITVAMKAGTNETHGSLFYNHRNPALNAMTDRVNRGINKTRNNIYGGSVGNPILKNKLFNYAVYEAWKVRNPYTMTNRVPTELEKQGDFSQTRGLVGAAATPVTIFDPWTTVLNQATNTAARTPFAGGRIPASRMDPTGKKFVDAIWNPTGPGDDVTGRNNSRQGVVQTIDYWNFTDRVDYQVKNNLRIYGRASLFRTVQDVASSALSSYESYVPNGAFRHSYNYSGDVVWTINANTVLNVHGDFHSMVDDWTAPGKEMGVEGLTKYWGSSKWYEPYLKPDLPVYFPRVQVNGEQYGMSTYYWYQRPNADRWDAKISRQRGPHYLKAGFDMRRTRNKGWVPKNSSYFDFRPDETASTYLNPDTRASGNSWASTLLGAVDPTSTAYYSPFKQNRTTFLAAFLNDDFKVNRRITLNLGLRWEHETPWKDPILHMSRGLDLSQPNPDMKANPPVMPDSVKQYLAVTTPQIFNGIWQFTDSQNPNIFETSMRVFQPRAGMAVRINDKTSVSLGYARYVIPVISNQMDFLAANYPGYDSTQTTLGALEGVPRVKFSDPWPASNPLTAPLGEKFGRYLGLGGSSLEWIDNKFKQGTNDRFNFTIHREVKKVLIDSTYFINIGRNLGTSFNVNQTDPRLSWTYKAALDARINNPFYNYLTADQFPGPLRNTAQVTIGSLLKPYPQYGNLSVRNNPWQRNTYQALELRAQRPFRDGFTVLVGYNYNRQRALDQYDALQTYMKEYSWLDSGLPRHTFTASGLYEIPVGRGRTFGTHMPKAIDAVVGGWRIAGTLVANTGSLIPFGPFVVNGDPSIDNPGPGKWFNTSVFSLVPAYTRRANPKIYPGIRGPRFRNMDANISKRFRFTERYNAELRASAFNLTNSINWAGPNMSFSASTFGASTSQAVNTTGRQLEIGLTIHF